MPSMKSISAPRSHAAGEETSKLDMLNSARVLQDLHQPPGNRLEALRGDLRGLYSIRINEQWRIVFRWSAGEAHEVRIVDYHR